MPATRLNAMKRPGAFTAVCNAVIQKLFGASGYGTHDREQISTQRWATNS